MSKPRTDIFVHWFPCVTLCPFRSGRPIISFLMLLSKHYISVCMYKNYYCGPRGCIIPSTLPPCYTQETSQSHLISMTTKGPFHCFVILLADGTVKGCSRPTTLTCKPQLSSVVSPLLFHSHTFKFVIIQNGITSNTLNSKTIYKGSCLFISQSVMAHTIVFYSLKLCCGGSLNIYIYFRILSYI